MCEKCDRYDEELNKKIDGLSYVGTMRVVGREFLRFADEFEQAEKLMLAADKVDQIEGIVESAKEVLEAINRMGQLGTFIRRVSQDKAVKLAKFVAGTGLIVQLKPRIVAIIGSTRFKQFHLGVAQRETLKGNIVLIAGFFHHVDNFPITDQIKENIDELMLRKIELADSVFVVNVNGYLGETTKEGIEYARRLEKPIEFLEPLDNPSLST